jgi:hypothetical protein
VGLLMATPLTVCLMVLGKHLPALGFIVVLMDDRPWVRCRREGFPAHIGAH